MKKYSFYALPLFACLPAFCKAEELRECIPCAGPKSIVVEGDVRHYDVNAISAGKLQNLRLALLICV